MYENSLLNSSLACASMQSLMIAARVSASRSSVRVDRTMMASPTNASYGAPLSRRPAIPGSDAAGQQYSRRSGATRWRRFCASFEDTSPKRRGSAGCGADSGSKEGENRKDSAVGVGELVEAEFEEDRCDVGLDGAVGSRIVVTRDRSVSAQPVALVTLRFRPRRGASA